VRYQEGLEGVDSPKSNVFGLSKKELKDRDVQVINVEEVPLRRP
jgi:hypothetical protein